MDGTIAPPRTSRAKRTPAPRPGQQAGTQAIDLALQGGGAHGAFTWGVLDRLLEDEGLAIEGISGTSAGAVNAAVLAYGMLDGGREGARSLLRTFWRRNAHAARFSIFRRSPIDKFFGHHNLDFSPAFQAFDLMTRMLSPYEFNPLGINPLRDILCETVDFERLRRTEGIKLFINTTNVRTGKIRVFNRDELLPEVLLASSCLPNITHAVEIDGEHYWDGGFMGNPAMFPLLYKCKASDIVLVEINPIRVEELPDTAQAIADRMNSIGFNATMMREMRTIAFVTRMLDQHRLTGKSNLRRINFHMIQAEREMAQYGVSSKFNADWDFLTELFELGRRTADNWVKVNYEKIGVDSSIDLQKLFF